MSERSRQVTGAAARGNGDAGKDARGSAMHGAIAEDAARAAKVRRSAWLLALLAAAFYVGFIVWNVLRAPLGG
jgi:hypothetical protein